MEENGQLIEFIYSDREVLTEESARTYYHYVSDEPGSITHVLDAEGQVQNRYEYDAFGNLVLEEEKVSNRMKYCGEVMDSITQQYYLRARFYNPQVARFISEDTYYGDGLNLYAYCHNNPVGYVDPSGHDQICAKKFQELKVAGLSPKEAYIMTKAEFLERECGSKAARDYLESKGVTIEVDSYKNLKKKVKNDPNSTGNEQVHHLSQNAAFKDKIKRNDGLCVVVEGNAFKDVGSSHYKVHESTEKFWDQYRAGGSKSGEVVKTSDYNKATYNALKDAGFSDINAAYATSRAVSQQNSSGVGKNIKKTPRKIYQRKRR